MGKLAFRGEGRIWFWNGALGITQRREKLAQMICEALNLNISGELNVPFQGCLETMNDTDKSKEYGKRIKELLKLEIANDKDRIDPLPYYISKLSDHLIKKSTWIFGGDGWAYDIGYAGLDHVIATGHDVNILVLGTEVYSRWSIFKIDSHRYRSQVCSQRQTGLQERAQDDSDNLWLCIYMDMLSP